MGWSGEKRRERRRHTKRRRRATKKNGVRKVWEYKDEVEEGKEEQRVAMGME